MQLAKRSPPDGNAPSAFNPLIDVVFLLLVFFLLSARFLPDERQLSSRLPPRGDAPDPPVALSEEVILELAWREGTVTASARASSAGTFRERPPRDFPGTFRRELGYGVPDFASLERYLRERRSALGPDVAVTLGFDDRVPVQAVVSVVDICARLGLWNFGLAPAS